MGSVGCTFPKLEHNQERSFAERFRFSLANEMEPQWSLGESKGCCHEGLNGSNHLNTIRSDPSQNVCFSKLCNQLGPCWLRKTISEKLTNMVPKWSQNLSKIEPGGSLDATWEPSLKQDASKTSFLTILAPFWDPHLGPVWGHFGHHVFYVFLKWLFDGFGLHLDSQKTSEMRPKRGSKSRR